MSEQQGIQRFFGGCGCGFGGGGLIILLIIAVGIYVYKYVILQEDLNYEVKNLNFLSSFLLYLF